MGSLGRSRRRGIEGSYGRLRVKSIGVQSHARRQRLLHLEECPGGIYPTPDIRFYEQRGNFPRSLDSRDELDVTWSRDIWRPRRFGLIGGKISAVRRLNPHGRGGWLERCPSVDQWLMQRWEETPPLLGGGSGNPAGRCKSYRQILRRAGGCFHF